MANVFDYIFNIDDCIQTTCKLMGGDGVAAAQVLTTAMIQYGVSFEGTNAAILVLGKAGKKASVGGVALRNVLGQLHTHVVADIGL